MTRYYIDKGSDEMLKVNISGNEYLASITLNLWKKIGFAPKTEEDCRIIARIIENILIHNEFLIEYSKAGDNQSLDSFKEKYDLKIIDHDTIVWLREDVLPFFKKAKGIEE